MQPDSAVAVVPAGSPRGTGHERGSGHAEPGRARASRGTGGSAGRGWTRRVGPDTGDSRAGGTPRLGGISWITCHVGPCRMGNGPSVSQAVAPEIPARVGVLAPLRLREYSAAARRHVPLRVPRWTPALLSALVSSPLFFSRLALPPRSVFVYAARSIRSARAVAACSPVYRCSAVCLPFLFR